MNIINPKFNESFYKGQDTVNYGSLIPLGLTAKEYLQAFDRNTRRKINSGENNDIIYRNLVDAHLEFLQEMWFDRKDATFPTKLDSGMKGFVAFLDGAMIGGIIWKESGNNLFLSQLISNENGKEVDLPTLLIWYSIAHFNLFENSKKYKNLDIGVSYNSNRQRFMQGFAVKTYPVILKPPFYKPVIRLSPFRSFEDTNPKHKPAVLADNVTFVPRASYGLYALLKYLDLKPNDDIVILKTFNTTFISGCVTQQIEKVCKWHLAEPEESLRGKIVLFIHEFGIPVPIYTNEWVKNLQDTEAIVIEDCAWRNEKVFEDSKYAIFSAQKMLNINFGGLIYGVHIPDEKLWEIGCLDIVKRNEFLKDDTRFDDIGADNRINNWLHYDQLREFAGMEEDDSYDYWQAIKEKRWTPTVYMQKFKDEAECIAIKQRLEDFGIQAGIYWGKSVLYLPIHQNMSTAEVEYMFAVVAGYFNTCRDYHGK